MIEIHTTEEFDEWLHRLKDRVAAAIIARRIDRLKRGLFGDVKPVGAGFSELRIDHGPGYRVYMVQQGQTFVILLCGGEKHTQQKDIATAKALAREL